MNWHQNSHLEQAYRWHALSTGVNSLYDVYGDGQEIPGFLFRICLQPSPNGVITLTEGHFYVLSGPLAASPGRRIGG